MKVLTTPHPFLRHTAKPINQLTTKTIKEALQMIDTLKQARDPEGVGLAATQVGLDKRIFILLKPDKQATIYINPQIISTSKLTTSQKYPQDQDRPLEGCLSIPRIWGFVDRPYRIKAKYQTFNPDQSNPTLTTVTKTIEGFHAIAFQHETDHLNGILFTDHILEQSGTILKETPSGLQPIKPELLLS